MIFLTRPVVPCFLRSKFVNSLRKQPSFFAPVPSGVLREGRLRFTAENFLTEDENLSRIWSWGLIARETPLGSGAKKDGCFRRLNRQRHFFFSETVLGYREFFNARERRGTLLGLINIKLNQNTFVLYYMASSVSGMNQIARCNWLLERARWSYLARSGLPTLSRKKNFSKGQIINPLLTKRVGSRWLDIGQVLFLASLWTETESRSINTKILKLPSLRSFVLLLPGDRN